MIIKGLFSMVLGLLRALFGWVSFPAMPEAIDSAFQLVLDSMASAMGFVWMIVPRELVLVGLPLVLILSNFDKLYSVIMWILRKIPFLGIQ